jgi:hypothetical protein
MRDTLLLVGNGLAIDYRSHSPGMPDPGRPLDYPLSVPGSGGQPLREMFSDLWKMIDAFRASEPDIGDFPLIARLCQMPRLALDRSLIGTPAWSERFREYQTRELVEYQLRLHLTHAYTQFTEMIDKTDLQSWRWFSWLRENSDRLNAVASFNYDLLPEHALRATISIRYLIQGGGMFGVNQEVVIFKPHGSVNFEFAENAIHGLSRSGLYAARNAFRLANVPLRVLGDGDLNQQRLNADIVLPTEASSIRHFQYIEPGYRYLRSIRGDIARCVIIGISYWECDQPEIDEILGNLRSDVHVLICNPYPPAEMIRRWSAHFKRLELVTAGLPHP